MRYARLEDDSRHKPALGHFAPFLLKTQSVYVSKKYEDGTLGEELPKTDDKGCASQFSTNRAVARCECSGRCIEEVVFRVYLPVGKS